MKFPESFRCLIIGPSNCGKTHLLVELLLNEKYFVYDKMFIWSRSLHQPYYQLLNTCFNDCLPKKDTYQLFKNLLDIKLYAQETNKPLMDVVDELVQIIKARDDFSSSHIICECNEDIIELPDPKEIDISNNNLVIFDDLIDEKQSQLSKYFTRGRHNNINTIYISQSYFHLPRKTIRNNSNFLILFKLPMKDVENIYQDLVSADMIIKEFKTLCQLAWSKPFGYLIIDLTKDRFLGKYRVGVDQFYLPESNPLS